MRNPTISLILTAWLICTTAAGSHAKPTPRCTRGVFVLVDPVVLGSVTRFQTIVVDAGQIRLGEQCSAPVKLRAGKRGATTFKTAVPGCPGVRGKVMISGTLDSTCGSVSGSAKAKKVPRVSFAASLTRCGDAVVDATAGEECEGTATCSSGQPCDAATCRCTVPTGNRRPVASPSSLRVSLVLPYVEQGLIGTDPDGDTLTYELASATQGTGYSQAYVNSHTGRFYLSVAQGFTGHIDVSYRVTDGQLFSEPAAIAIDVQSSTDPRGTGDLPVTPAVYAGFDHRNFRGDLLGAPGAGAGVPASVDLAPLFPSPGDQGHQSSCVGWATAYALKSYQEGREVGWDLNTTEHLFSPAYVYNQINEGRDEGSLINRALDLVVAQGVATWALAPYSDADFVSQPSPAAHAQAGGYKGMRWSTVNSVAEMKAALANRLPVVGGIAVYPQLQQLAGPESVYNSAAGQKEGGHAITFVGYDDGRFGGSFKIINSWTTQFGDNGFFYMPYDFVPQVLTEAYVLEDAPNTAPPGPTDPTVPPPTGDLPNFQVVSWGATYDPKPNGQGKLVYNVANTGAGTAAKGADVNLMLSRDQSISPDDVYIVYEQIPFDLPSGVAVVRDQSNPIDFTFPDDIAPGNYYMALWVDDLEEVTESNETDNISPGSNVIPIASTLPDLEVDSWYATADGSLTYAVANIGYAAAPPGWLVSLVLSPNDTIGDGDEIGLFSDQATAPLPVGSNLYRDDTNPGRFVLDSVPAGSYFAAVVADPTGQLAESNETNNASLSWAPVDIGAAFASPSRAAVAGTPTSPELYNGKRLPDRAVLMRKVQISASPQGGRRMTVLDEPAHAAKVGPRPPGMFAKQIKAADQVVFPVVESRPMPNAAGR